MIGTGRRRANYQTRRIVAGSGDSALVQIGWDQVDQTDTLTASVIPADRFTDIIIRNGGVAPLQVQLPNVTAGNRLRIDYSGTAAQTADQIDAFAYFIAVVSFNGVTGYAPGVGFSWVNNSGAACILPLATSRTAFRGLASCEIPVGATTATVQIAYTTTVAGVSVFGISNFAADARAAGMTLEVSEILAAAAAQPGPTTLIPYV